MIYYVIQILSNAKYFILFFFGLPACPAKQEFWEITIDADY